MAGAASSAALAWFGSLTGWIGTGWAALDFTGVAPVGFVVLGTAVGFASAVLVRRSWPATIAAMVVTLALRALVPWSLLHLMRPTEGGVYMPPGSFTVRWSYPHSFYFPPDAYPGFQALDLGVALVLSACLIAIAFAAIARLGRAYS